MNYKMIIILIWGLLMIGLGVNIVVEADFKDNWQAIAGAYLGVIGIVQCVIVAVVALFQGADDPPNDHNGFY